MDFQNLKQCLIDSGNQIVETLMQTETYAQLTMVLLIFVVALIISTRLRKYFPLLAKAADDARLSPLRKLASKMGNLLFPLISILILSFVVDLSEIFLGQTWLVQTALTVALLLMFIDIIQDHVRTDFMAFVFRWVGFPLLFLRQVNLLDPIINVLESMQVTVGNIQVSAYGVLRVALFGTLLFWLERFRTVPAKKSSDTNPSLIFAPKKWPLNC